MRRARMPNEDETDSEVQEVQADAENSLVMRAFDSDSVPRKDDTIELLSPSSKVFDRWLGSIVARVPKLAHGREALRGWAILKFEACGEDGERGPRQPCPDCATALTEAQRFLNQLVKESEWSILHPHGSDAAFVRTNGSDGTTDVLVDVDGTCVSLVMQELQQLGQDTVAEARNRRRGPLRCSVSFATDSTRF
jgi:hypothetical protein